MLKLRLDEIQEIYQEQILRNFYHVVNSNYKDSFMLIKNTTLPLSKTHKLLRFIFILQKYQTHHAKKVFKKWRSIDVNTSFWKNKAICILTGLIQRKLIAQQKSTFERMRSNSHGQMVEPATMLKLYFDMMFIVIKNLKNRSLRGGFNSLKLAYQQSDKVKQGLYSLSQFCLIRRMRNFRQFFDALSVQNIEVETGDNEDEEVAVEAIKTIAISMKKPQQKSHQPNYQIEAAHQIAKSLEGLLNRKLKMGLKAFQWNEVCEYDEELVDKLQTEIDILQRQFQSL